jgi:hypothetical protein
MVELMPLDEKEARMKYLLSAAIGCCVLLTIGHAENAKDPRAAARAKYGKHSADALKIAEPAKYSQGFGWKDGGTVGIALVDAKDEKFSFALYSPFGAGLPEKDDSKPPRIIPNLFVGATYPGHKGSKMVEVRGPEEAALYGVLLRIIDKHKDKDLLLAKDIDLKLWEARNVGVGMYELHTFFHRLEAHFLEE